MAENTEIEKLNPGLLEKSEAQLEREITERQMALVKLKEKKEAEKRVKMLEEAQMRFDRMLDDIKWSHENGFLAPALVETFTDKTGTFNPARRMKRPRAKD